ncbi:MAG: two-component system sensor histidine kinase NtrB [Candidatus Puniceispirillaceae bacterium]
MRNSMITSHIKSEQESAFPLAEVMDVLPFPIVLLDHDDSFIWLNHAGEQFFKSSLSILSGTRLDRLIPKDSQIFSLIRRARQSGTSVEDKAITFVGPRIGLRGASIQLVPFPLSNFDQPVMLMTLQERAGAEQLATQQNFKGAALSMSRMSALLAHEIKNPLAGIKGAAQLLEMELPEAHHELSHMIVSETDRITSLLQRIENLSSDAPVRFETVNIHEVLDHCLKITSASFGRHLEIKRSYDPSLPDIQADREMLVQCFVNLFKNASEATEAGDSLSLQTSYSLTRYVTTETSRKLIHLPLQIAIKDSGKGVSDDLQAHIFEPFVSNKSGGSGLGLAMVASVIADHGGAIAMHSSPQGSCFTLNLPITQGYNDATSVGEAVL